MPKKMPEAVLDWFREKGSQGGKKSVAMFTAAQRKARAKAAAKARWAKVATEEQQ